MRICFYKAAFALIILIPAASMHGQVATGTYPYGTFDSKGFDVINLGNLNVHFAIPVLNKTGRGIPFYYNLSYDSSVWYPATVSGIKSWVPAQAFGWRGDTEIATGYMSYNYISGVCLVGTVREPSTIITLVAYHDSFGVIHGFSGGLTFCGSTQKNTLQTNANDGSGYQIQSYAGPVVTRSRTTFQVPSNTESGAASVTDSNGNEISVNNSGQFTDTTGNVVLTVTGTAPSPQTFAYKDTNGNAQTVTMTYKTYTVKTAFGCSGIGEYGPASTSLVDTLSFPDGSAYHFSYEATPGASGDVTGRLASIELPQGNTIQYSYSGGNNGIECADGSTAALTRTLNSDSESSASTWSYSRTTGTNTSHTEVVDGLANHLAYDFVEPSNLPNSETALYYETNRNVYQGAENGTPVVARHTCYNGAASPCITATFTLPVSQIDTYETLDGVQMHGATAKYNTYGMQTEADAYDFGSSSSRGLLLRKEVWTYGGSIPSLVTEDQVFDGSSNLAGQTLYGYDGSTPVVSSGIPQHVAVGSVRGNLTSETLYANSSTSYSLSATYEDTGSLLTSTAPTGTTTLSYDSTFVYNTGATLPTPSSRVAIGASETFDTAHTGLPLSSTDPNAQVTSVSSYDSMLRPAEIQYPDGGETTWSYTPTQLSQHAYQTSSVYANTETQFDGYGRSSRIAIANGQAGSPWYQNDTCYDANGNVAYSSYPYQGTGFGASKVCSVAGTGDNYTYDVLGRLKTVTRANGETRTYTYLGRATQAIDENGVTRISQMDGLGRPTIVCEISAGNNMLGSGSPVSCGTDLPGTGFTTTYSYALVTHTTTITQGAQTRTFQTDWLGRTTSVVEPESGTTTYGYAYNSTGLVVTRNRPKANQTSASVLTTATTQYDSLNRPVSITYSDGTPTKNFAYDSTQWGTLTQTNLKGRLSLATVSNAGTEFSYDSMGRVNGLDECLPSGCGNGAYDRQLYYTYDLAGNLLTSTDGAGVTSSYTISSANEILSLSSSLSDATHPPHLLSNVQNGPNGPVNYGLGNGLTGVSTYDTLGRTAGGWVCSGSSQPYCSGGSQFYGFTSGWSGVRETGECDTALNQCIGYGYDEFNRLTSRSVNSGTPQNFTYVYDRYGNRWQQNLTAGSGPAPLLTFNTTNNQVSGYNYDAAGNMENDSSHGYTYDAEGNITAVDAGNTATYAYNALNQRVRTVVGTTITEFLFNSAGQRVSIWNGSNHSQIQGQYYWGMKPVAYYAGGATHFQHQDWLGSERLRTTYNGGVEGTFTSLPFGDGQTTSGTDGDPYHYAMLDHDTESDTDHAQFRQYNNTQGHWLSPDPYSGSYDVSNPQSFNRYAYASNNPLVNTDPSGLLCYPQEVVWYGGCSNMFGGNSAFGETWNEFDISQMTLVYGPMDPGQEDVISGPAGPDLYFYLSGADSRTGPSTTPSNGTSTCTISNGRTTGIAPGQAPGVGAFGFVPQAGSVAIDPWALGLPPGGSTNALLGSSASQITFSFSPAPNLPRGYPTTITLGSIVGPKSVRTGGANFNGFFDFDFYGMPSLAAAYAVTAQPVAVTVTYPSSLPISCNGPALDSPISGPLPSPPGPVPAVASGGVRW